MGRVSVSEREPLLNLFRVGVIDEPLRIRYLSTLDNRASRFAITINKLNNGESFFSDSGLNHLGAGCCSGFGASIKMVVSEPTTLIRFCRKVISKQFAKPTIN